MKLAEYLAHENQTQAEFAARLGLTQGNVSKMCRGQRLPSLPLAAEIERATGGLVPMSVWCACSEPVDRCA